MKRYFYLFLLFALIVACDSSKERKVIPAKTDGAVVSQEKMNEIYDQVKTPCKYGVVLKAENDKKVDCPSIFRFGEKWFMVYIVFDGKCYETQLAESPDLLNWTPLGTILSHRDGTWDALQTGGYVALQDFNWGGSYELEKHKRKYWMSYLGGALSGYETDPLSIGMAFTDDPSKPEEWQRLENPVLDRDQPDARFWEKLTLYKSNIIYDPVENLGYPFVMFYNAKTKSGYERIGMAVSKNMKTWLRYGIEPVVDNGSGISGDPQIVKMGDVWVMFYFGAFWEPNAFDTFACSYDLVNWTKWEGAHLIEPSQLWDQTYAHKPWVVKYNDVVYHYYCAVGDQGRVIALATSKDLK